MDRTVGIIHQFALSCGTAVRDGWLTRSGRRVPHVSVPTELLPFLDARTHLRICLGPIKAMNPLQDLVPCCISSQTRSRPRQEISKLGTAANRQRVESPTRSLYHGIPRANCKESAGNAAGTASTPNLRGEALRVTSSTHTDLTRQQTLDQLKRTSAGARGMVGRSGMRAWHS